MKKLFISGLFITAVLATANAQTSTMAATGSSMSKADKAAAKAKKEADLTEAFNKAGLTNDEQLKSRAALDASNEKSKVIKADTALTEEDKKAKLEAVNKERNDELKTIMGEAKYKIFKAAQKAQKEAAGTNAAQ